MSSEELGDGAAQDIDGRSVAVRSEDSEALSKNDAAATQPGDTAPTTTASPYARGL